MARRKIDKAALASLIRDLKELSNEQKADLLQLLNEQKRYGLVWEEHNEEAQEVLSENIPVLVEDPSKCILSLPRSGESEGAPNHILIEGDNLHALTALTYTHEGKVDVIYIDPPYNTGNKDFVYNDSFVDSEDGYRHSKWLSFMEKRLRIAKKLLSDRGVIFISIDDNEQANLKLLCDEVFGVDLFVGNAIWEKADSPRMDVTGFSVRHDYILVYGMRDFELKRLPVNEIPEHYNRIDEQGRRYYTKPMRIMGGHISESLFYPMIAPDGTEVYPYDKKGAKSGWRWSKKKVEEEYERIDWVNGKNGWNPYFRIYADNMREMPVETIWKFEQVGSNRTAKNSLNEILGDNAFSYPKPTTLIGHIVKIGGFVNSTILDFFAGSGTTLHATMQLNAEDGGHRKCILVTNNENNICEDVTYERNKRVINGYTTQKGVEVAGLKDNNLRFYRTEFVPRDLSATGQKNLMLASTDLLCIKNDLYDEKDMFGDIKLRKHIARYFDDGKQKMLIIYKIEAIESLVEEMAKMPEDIKIKVYVFSTNNYAMDDDFEEVADKVELYAMPAALWNAYKKVLPRKKDNINEEDNA